MKTEKIAYNIYHLSNISCTFYENGIKTYETNPLNLPDVLKNQIEDEKLNMASHQSDNKIYRICNDIGLNYLWLYANDRNIIFGPFLINDDYEKYIDHIILENRMINEDAKMVEHFYNTLKILSEFQQKILVNILKSITQVDFEDTRIYNVQTKRIYNNLEIDRPSVEQTMKMIEETDKAEKILMKIINDGDVKSAENFDFSTITNRQLFYRNNSFTSLKTNLLIFNALAYRVALNTGLDLFLGHKILNNIKFHINKVSSSSEIKNLASTILITYTKAVRDYTLINHSHNIKQIILYIRKNLTKKIALEDIAKDLYITKEHLSRLFKKEMGITISEYIINEKIKEAKNLLKNSDFNILNIAEILNFANSSHFSNSFKKVTGVAPSAYRNNPTD